MLATDPTGFMNLNAANAWPSFTLQNLAIDPRGVLRLTATGTEYASSGLFMGGPFRALDGNTPWYRFTLECGDGLPANTHLQMFTWTAASGSPPFSPSSNTPFPGWQAAPRDALQGVIFNTPEPELWVGGVVRSDGSATPAIHQIRIDYGRDTYLKYLPGIYRADPLRRTCSIGCSRYPRLRWAIFATKSSTFRGFSTPRPRRTAATRHGSRG